MPIVTVTGVGHSFIYSLNEYLGPLFPKGTTDSGRKESPVPCDRSRLYSLASCVAESWGICHSRWLLLCRRRVERHSDPQCHVISTKLQFGLWTWKRLMVVQWGNSKMLRSGAAIRIVNSGDGDFNCSLLLPYYWKKYFCAALVTFQLSSPWWQ